MTKKDKRNLRWYKHNFNLQKLERVKHTHTHKTLLHCLVTANCQIYHIKHVILTQIVIHQRPNGKLKNKEEFVFNLLYVPPN